MADIATIRSKMREFTLSDDQRVLTYLSKQNLVTQSHRDFAVEQGRDWVRAMRENGESGLMDVFMAEYGLSSDEGIALMCLAEALLRVPDSETMDELIEDKIAPSDWGSHLGKSSSSLVNASTWALMLTGRVLDDERPMAGVLHGVIKRLGEPVIRQAVRRAMRELGEQFVLGQTINEAIKNGAKARKKGYTYSYDMLGEAARTAQDARAFYESYANAIKALAPHANDDDIRNNPGISIKLSALFERYEVAQKARVMETLVPRLLRLAEMAKAANMGLNIDAEEANRLELSMEVIEAVMRSPSLDGWGGFGIVVQAYGKRASFVIDWFYALASELDRKVMLRLVKGAYWDTEIKLAQVLGLEGFPVFACKAATDISYIENAAKLFARADRIYPQFATHNAHTVAMVKALAGEFTGFEYQRLHGMGDALYNEVMKDANARCRIYAPVGVHEDLLAYLVRRLLENGANSSFVNQVLDEDVAVEDVVSDPYAQALTNPIALPADIFGKRKNSRGWDLTDYDDLADIETARTPFKTTIWNGAPIVAFESGFGESIEVRSPSTGEAVGTITLAQASDVDEAAKHARIWDAPVSERAAILRKTADLFEENYGEIFALLAREAGKTLADAIAELREAVDFLRYYADEAEARDLKERGIFACISPWNFPLAIFTGQIAAALAAGNAVLAKPAEASSLIAYRAVEWLHEAGVPKSALQFLPGFGAEVGSALSANAAIQGMTFTGSTATAQAIHRNMAKHLSPDAQLIAETGGLNAMIVDSTALPEQAVRDLVMSAFQSAGQRCSACRVLFVQNDTADRVLEMLAGAMDALRLGDPWHLSTDIGPVIDARAKAGIVQHIAQAEAEGRVLKRLDTPDQGTFVAPTVIELDAIGDLQKEIFGPVLHVVRYDSEDLSKIVDEINATGYGLTFGMHSRIDDRVETVAQRIKAGNLYINRNQIGAIVGSQPFGGEGLSGTGPKAGGPLYLHRFSESASWDLPHNESLPGPTGESNQWSRHPRGRLLCAGPGNEAANAQAKIAKAEGCEAIIAPNAKADQLHEFDPIDGVVYWGEEAREWRNALAERDGAILPLITALGFAPYCWVERHICIDTTAAGGNVELMA